MIKEMNPEVYTQKGELRKRAPKKFVCRTCGHKMNQTGNIKLPGVTFHACKNCNGSKIDPNSSFKEWFDEKAERMMEKETIR